jgi:hypothetical protein
LELHTQEHKAVVLHDFYLNHLGTKVTTSWNFFLNDLYPEDAPPFNTLLIALLSMKSILPSEGCTQQLVRVQTDLARIFLNPVGQQFLRLCQTCSLLFMTTALISH